MNGGRWLVVLGALLIQPCLGAIYGWGAFVPALKATEPELVTILSAKVLGVDSAVHKQVLDEFKVLKKQLAESHAESRDSAKAALARFVNEEIPARVKLDPAVLAKHHYGFSATQTQSIFAVAILMFAVAMIFAGRWQDRVGPRIVALTGGLVWAAGYAIAGLGGTSFPTVMFGIGVVGGIGLGLGYVCPIAACVKWFPDLRGLITGLAVAGFGGGAFLFVKLAGAWGGVLPAEGVATTFLIFAAIFAVCTSAGAMLLRNPPPGFKPAGWNPAASTKTAHARHDFTQRQTLSTAPFYLLWVAFMLASGCGMMVIVSLKDFGTNEGGLSDAQAESALVLLALFNALGRISWGAISQKLTPRRTLIAVSLLQAIMVVTLIRMGGSELMLSIAGCWVGFNFGGNLALFPLLTSEYFGTKNLGANYGLMFTAYGIGGVVGPMLAGAVWDSQHSYYWAFLPASLGCLAAMVLAIVARPPAEPEAVQSLLATAE